MGMGPALGYCNCFGRGFVVTVMWVGERTFGTFNFFRRLDKDHEKTTESSEAWVLWQNCQIIINRLAPYYTCSKLKS